MQILQSSFRCYLLQVIDYNLQFKITLGVAGQLYCLLDQLPVETLVGLFDCFHIEIQAWSKTDISEEAEYFDFCRIFFSEKCQKMSIISDWSQNIMTYLSLSDVMLSSFRRFIPTNGRQADEKSAPKGCASSLCQFKTSVQRSEKSRGHWWYR